MIDPHYVIKGGQVILADRVIKQDLRIANGTITEMAAHLTGTREIDAEGKLVLPGFVDIHNHGAAGFDFSFGQYQIKEDHFISSPVALEVGLKNALDFYLSKGITKIYLTSMAAPVEKLTRAFSQLNTFLRKNSRYENLVAGINVEGTFLKDPAYAGAQNPRFFYELDLKFIEELNDAANGRIKIINIPPEHGDEALKTIAELTARGIVVAAGHTASYGDQLEKAIEAGLTLSVHFLNGPSRHSSKSFHKGGAQEMMLQSDDMFLEVITDGYHVAPAYFRDILARKGADRVISITDSMFANGLKDLKQFSMFGLTGAVSDNRKYLKMSGSEDTLFGSVLSTDVAFSNMVAWLTQERSGIWHRSHQAFTEDEAFIMASQFASTNPSRLLQPNVLPADLKAGSIAVGNRADVIIGTWHQARFEVTHSFVDGELLWQASN